MLDIVAPDQHQLALTIDGEGVDDAQPRLARTATGHPEPVAEHASIEDVEDERREGDQGHYKGNPPDLGHLRPNIH